MNIVEFGQTGKGGLLIKTGEGAFRAESPFIVNPKDGSILVKVPAGEFEMGDGKADDCPKHRVYLDNYYIGIYCITNRQYGKFVKEAGHRKPDNSLWDTVEKADHPVTDVSHDDAAAYAKWAGLSLPTEAQWEKSARGVKGYLYPWGNEFDGNKCRYDKNKGSDKTCNAYDYAAGASGYGCYNTSGNVWEWCADWYDSDYYKKSQERNPKGPESGSSRVLRGGSWGSDDEDDLRSAYRNDDRPGLRDVNYGFRCVWR